VHGCIGGKLDTSISIIMNVLMRAFAANSNMLHVTEGEHWRGVGGYINLVRSGTTLPFYIPLLHRITKRLPRKVNGCVLSSLKMTQVPHDGVCFLLALAQILIKISLLMGL
jgi:hypothetical protein